MATTPSVRYLGNCFGIIIGTIILTFCASVIILIFQTVTCNQKINQATLSPMINTKELAPFSGWEISEKYPDKNVIGVKEPKSGALIYLHLQPRTFEIVGMFAVINSGFIQTLDHVPTK